MNYIVIGTATMLVGIVVFVIGTGMVLGVIGL